MAAFGRRQLVVVLFVFFFVVFSMEIPVSRSLKTVKNSFHVQGVNEIVENDEVLLERLLIERRMNIEVEDYPGTGANRNHDPRPPAWH